MKYFWHQHGRFKLIEGANPGFRKFQSWTCYLSTKKELLNSGGG